MKAVGYWLTGVAALALAACGGQDEASPADTQPAGAGTEAAGEAESPTQALVGNGELDHAAEDACRGEDDAAVLAALPDGAAFSSRGPDGMVVVACKLDGDGSVYRIDSTALEGDMRSTFDLAAAEHMRFGLRPNDDRSGTGVYRMRDGRFCAIQTEREISERVCEAAEQAAAGEPTANN
jgi:hypothetical protein